MKAVVLKAHLEGENIRLDEPFQITPSAKIFVTVVEDSARTEAEEWYALSQQSLARAYGDDEPDYSDLVDKKPDQE
jgi:hypothetical protein